MDKVVDAPGVVAEQQTKISPAFVLLFDCSEEEMERRLLARNQGRVDDNIETIRKRFRVFVESSLPVIEYYNGKAKVKKIDAAKPISEVFEDVKAIFAPYAPKALNLKTDFGSYESPTNE
ncbi:hypothetical protein PR202_gb21718 [Eleusine coracana subsp. coracana]|uniref:adenylate kinase n=1 Tax=Eleusine coracana subsp. coracana TaxID=191504 RepID=A0AAV5FFT8_ELECO|nr:hypothetical protein PR202_gb21718 [Eleusine coracana subsp. coracana]